MIQYLYEMRVFFIAIAMCFASFKNIKYLEIYFTKITFKFSQNMILWNIFDCLCLNLFRIPWTFSSAYEKFINQMKWGICSLRFHIAPSRFDLLTRWWSSDRLLFAWVNFYCRVQSRKWNCKVGIVAHCLWEENLGNITEVFINDSFGFIARSLWFCCPNSISKEKIVIQNHSFLR